MYNRKAIVYFLIAGASLLLGVGVNLFVKEDSTRNLTDQISENLASEIKAIESEAERIISDHDESIWKNATHSFFLIQLDTVVSWSKHEFLPDLRLADEDFTIKLLQSSRGSYILRKWKFDEQSFVLSVLPLFEKYSISNRYLFPTWNTVIFNGLQVEIFQPSFADGDSITLDGVTLFKVKFPDAGTEKYSIRDSIIVACGWAALLSFTAGLFNVVNGFHRKKRFGSAFFVLLAGLTLVRLVMINLNFPREYSTFFIFDPLQFASSSLNPSIADLFFNTVVVLLIGIYFFYTYYRWPIVRRIKGLKSTPRFTVALICLLICFYTILFPFLFFETISHNSNISLDISQTIDFDLIRVLAFLSIVLGCVSTFLFCHGFFMVAVSYMRQEKLKFYLALTGAAFIFFLAYRISGKDYIITLLMGLLYFVVLYRLSLSSHLKRFSYTTFVYFLFAVLMLAVQGSFSIKRFVEEKTKEDQFKYGSNFLVDRDILGEYLLNDAVKRISADPFIQSRMSTPFLAKSGVRQKINQVYLNAYFDRYDVQVYLYNASGESHDNFARENFASLIKAFKTEANKTTYEGIYFIESANQEAAKRYLTIIPIHDHGPAGYVVLDLSLKKLIPQNVFPELLVDNQFINYFRNTDFSYAFYLNKKLVSNSGNYNYERDFKPDFLGQINLYNTGLQEGGFTHIGMEDESGRVAVVSAPSYDRFSLLANFSFLFVLGLSFVLFLLILFALVLWVRGERLNYAARIQAYVYLAFLLPLLVVSVSTLSLISSSEELELNTEFLNKSKIIGDRLSGELDFYFRNKDASKAEFEEKVVNLARLANLDASVFSRAGKLIASSQPLIYQNQLVSGLIDRTAWLRIVTDKETSFVKNEDIGKLNFNTSYSSLKSPDTGELIGILSIPFFDSVHSLEKTQINVWVNILVIFVFVFLLFSIVSFLIVNWLTFPLRFITRTLGKTTFSGENKPLIWKSNDEIGLLVSEYNRMLENLELSRIELSRSQKESAWREIAKQVAHEINNPLTPMKLTLQRMELAQAKGTLSQEDTNKSLKTMLAQVEILNQIASSFSAFARMPAPVLQKMDISQVLKKVVDLHTNQSAATINLSTIGPISILGDDQLLTRVFSNVILNALQSVEEGKSVKIEVIAKAIDNYCVVSISDNGSGIADELKEKVFLPHFSTKKTGSGIGLAIAKQGIELSGGEIWFKSRIGEGTVFYIKLPLQS